MSQCDLCGKQTEVVRAMIEGSELVVCKSCSSYGKVLGPMRKIVPKAARPSVTPQAGQRLLTISSDYPHLIKAKREERGLRQIELARLLSEKESLLHSIESGKSEPSLDLARKLEKFLRIKLVEEPSEETFVAQTSGMAATLGDIVKIRKG